MDYTFLLLSFSVGFFVGAYFIFWNNEILIKKEFFELGIKNTNNYRSLHYDINNQGKIAEQFAKRLEEFAVEWNKIFHIFVEELYKSQNGDRDFIKKTLEDTKNIVDKLESKIKDTDKKNTPIVSIKRRNSTSKESQGTR